MHTATRAHSHTGAFERYVAGRTRAVAQLLGEPVDDLSAEFDRLVDEGLDPNDALDRLVLEAVR